MNKGIFAHIISSMIYSLLILYITRDIETTLGARIIVVMFFLFFNIITAAICDLNDWYKEKI